MNISPASQMSRVVKVQKYQSEKRNAVGLYWQNTERILALVPLTVFRMQINLFQMVGKQVFMT